MNKNLLITLFTLFLSGCDNTTKDFENLANKELTVISEKNLEYFFDDVDFYQFNSQGMSISNLKAKRAFAFKSSADLNLENINFYFYEKTPWRLMADKGVASENNSFIKLQENVNFYLKENQPHQIQVQSEELNIDLKNALAFNKKPVLILSREGQMQANSFKLNMDKNTLELKGRVIGKYKVSSYEE